MELPPSDEYVRERPRKPHWKKSNFWKTFGTMLVIYLILRILINLILDWSSAPAESTIGYNPEPSSSIAAQPAPVNPSE
jgi:hypothetical protein